MGRPRGSIKQTPTYVGKIIAALERADGAFILRAELYRLSGMTRPKSFSVIMARLCSQGRAMARDSQPQAWRLGNADMAGHHRWTKGGFAAAPTVAGPVKVRPFVPYQMPSALVRAAERIAVERASMGRSLTDGE